MGTTWNNNGRISGVDDVRVALQRVNQAAQTRGATALLPHAVQTADQAQVAPDVTQVMAADPQLLPLLPWPGGLRRGATISAVGSTSLILLLLYAAMRDNASWAAVVGMPDFGSLAAHEYGINDRLALVPDPGPDWPTIVATLLDGVDLVVVRPPAGTPDSLVRSLAARARQKKSVLIPTTAWPGADLVLETTAKRWHGLKQGRGRLRHGELDVRVAGRGRAARPKTATVYVPGPPPPPVELPPLQAAPEPAQPDSGPWANLEPSPPPANPWADLVREARTTRHTRQGR